MNRLDAQQQGKIFRTNEMTEWLQAVTGAPEEMIEALLGAWVGVLRYDALLHAEHDRTFLLLLQEGKVHLRLNEELVPVGWSNEGSEGWCNGEFWAYVAQETALTQQEIRPILSLIRQKLLTLVGQQAFEPLGWIAHGEGDILCVYCWPDFLQPVSDDPQTLLLGTI